MTTALNNSPEQHATALAAFIRAHAPVLLLTGAGISTDSGIPDYRDSNGNWKRKQPVQHQEFMQCAATRQRYWARSLVGWPIMQKAQPNLAHRKIAELENKGLLSMIVTQNVDRLHQKAGSDAVIDLHGRADELICMSCGYREARAHMHARCASLNPSLDSVFATAAPDGDADLEMDFSTFEVPGCPQCDGILKPDVVFFGDTVPRPRVDQVFDVLANSRGLLVIGSSLMVFSGFRFARQAHQANTPIAILTQGRTRADDLASIKFDVPIAPLLAAIQT
ncbi:NAD-dependent protein deacetylase [Pseudohongiella sp.]|uniref:Deacetylase sirtuin-type domain-containing protein n=1 Tax=marine sediment metagenome TaxID=412755 RepID=A0A0F9Y366_9ZZZZ|nr:NAD-dependent protein deacetylase [Pseudohongiella sp.]HDZ08873.1 NAD-dependent protein deacetylase [Pseudohongiella sp.]HEA64049.1 NAD-dependent protein deacetylase [Pseudohongiella sp.]